MTAPLGAAAYAVVETDTTARIIFAMMREGESGLRTLNRVYNENTTLQWKPVAARPEEQHAAAFGPDEYCEYTLVYQDGNWMPSNAAVANFMQAMQAAQSLPVSPPSDLATTISAFRPRGTTKVKTKEQPA